MNIIIASSNKGKIAEIQRWLPEHTVTPYSEILGSFEIDETGKTFQENAFKKDKAYFDKYKCPTLADDSGLVIPA